jgi:hypothetical protein
VFDIHRLFLSVSNNISAETDLKLKKYEEERDKERGEDRKRERSVKGGSDKHFI